MAQLEKIEAEYSAPAGASNHLGIIMEGHISACLVPVFEPSEGYVVLSMTLEDLNEDESHLKDCRFKETLEKKHFSRHIVVSLGEVIADFEDAISNALDHYIAKYAKIKYRFQEDEGAIIFEVSIGAFESITDPISLLDLPFRDEVKGRINDLKEPFEEILSIQHPIVWPA